MTETPHTPHDGPTPDPARDVPAPEQTLAAPGGARLTDEELSLIHI